MTPEPKLTELGEVKPNDTSLKSTFYEQLVEHTFISELLQEAWFGHNEVVEVMRSEIDAYGYDLVLECRGVLRHVQLKTSKNPDSQQNVATVLGDKPAGCIVLVVRVDPKNDIDANRTKLSYRFFGKYYDRENPEKDLKLNLTDFKPTKRTRATKVVDEEGDKYVKKFRRATLVVPKSLFKPDDKKTVKMSVLLNWLFGI